MAKRVLSLCKSDKRDAVKRAMSSAHFKVSFISALSELSGAIHSFKPDLFIHDWGAQDESQARQFHLKMGQSTQAIDLSRILLVPEVTPQLLAFASDAMIERLQSYGSIALTLGQEAKMLLDSKEASELQKFMRETKLDSFKYNQKAIDSKIGDLYEKFGHDPKVKLEYANLLLRQGSYQKALLLASELLNRDPLNLRATNLLARVKMKVGLWDEAVSLLQRANSLSPANPGRLVLIGDALFGKGDFDAALTNYHQAMYLDSDKSAEAGRQIGRIKLAKGELEEAVMFFKSAVSEEESAGFFNNAAVQAARTNHFSEALRLYESALQTLKTDRLKPLIFFNIALTHMRLTDSSNAAKALKKALHYDPNHEKSSALLTKIQSVKAS